LPTDYRATMGVDLYRFEVGGLGEDRSSTLELVIWDLDGNYGVNIFQHVYSKGASGALIVGDVMRYATLEHMVMLADGFTDAMPSRQFSFVVNKLDLIEKPDPKLLPEKLRSAQNPAVWTSAKTAHNVLNAFTQVSNAIVRREG